MHLCVTDVDVLVLMVANESQAESVLFGDCGAVSGTSYFCSISELIKHHFNFKLIHVVLYCL